MRRKIRQEKVKRDNKLYIYKKNRRSQIYLSSLHNKNESPHPLAHYKLCTSEKKCVWVRMEEVNVS